MEKIFISYNHEDQLLVDTIVRRLEKEFGSDNIFYDSWSIQPGDSIIDSMDAGLNDFTTFFLFVSPKSLKSNMVKLEWQTALNRAVNNDLKFVSVRIADCSMPTILTDKLYIDLYGEGIDSAIRKMKNVVKNENTYVPLDDVQNVQAYITMINSSEIKVIVEAKLFAENNPVIAIGMTGDREKFTIKQYSDAVVSTGKDIIEIADGRKYNASAFRLYRDLKPGEPFKVKVSLSKLMESCDLGIFIKIGEKDDETWIYREVPCVERN